MTTSPSNSDVPVHVIGAGGHAKVVLSVLQAAGYAIAGLHDDDPARQGEQVLGVPILGPNALLANTPETHAIIAIGSNEARKRIAATLDRVTWVGPVVHPSACVHESATIGVGTVIFAQAVVQPCAQIGKHVIINTAATVDHDCVLEDFVQLTPGVHLGGTVRLGEGAFLGVGCSVIHGRTLGGWITVGAGAAVVCDLPGRIVAVGVPARRQEQSAIRPPYLEADG